MLEAGRKEGQKASVYPISEIGRMDDIIINVELVFMATLTEKCLYNFNLGKRSKYIFFYKIVAAPIYAL